MLKWQPLFHVPPEPQLGAEPDQPSMPPQTSGSVIEQLETVVYCLDWDESQL